MATLQRYYPGGVTPNQYDPPIPGYDYMPTLAELVEFGDIVSFTSSATAVNYTFGNGLQFRYIGTGLRVNSDGETTAGTITEVRLMTSTGELIEQISGLSLRGTTLAPLMNMGGWDVQEYILHGNDTITGGNGADDLYGYAGNDTLRGGAGDDFFVGGAGTDTYAGGAGWDQLSFDDGFSNDPGNTGVTINATTGRATDDYGNAETFTSIESFRGTRFADTFTGSTADEQFMGMKGADRINGGGGFDEVRFHRDINRGGFDGVTVNLTSGYAIDGFGTRDTLTSIEAARGTAFDDTLIGSAVANRLRGDAGADRLYGKAGNDELYGGDGNDRFYFDTTLNRTSNVDEIADFNTVNDLIFLDNAIFSAIVGTGTMSSAQFYASNAGVAHDANDRIIYDRDNGNLYYDSNGSASGGSVLFATLSTGLNLTAADFYIY